MGKRITIISVILLIIGLAILGYYIQEGRKHLMTDPYKAIAPSACIVIETSDLQSFMNSLTTGKGIFGELAGIKEFENFTIRLKFLADQLNKPGYKKVLEGSTALISCYPSPEGKLNSLLTLALPGEIRSRHIKEILHSSGAERIIESKVSGNTLLSIPFVANDNKDTLFISMISGLAVCSCSKVVITAATHQMVKSGDVRNMSGFARVHMASGKKEDKIFIVFKNLPEVLKPHIPPSRKNLADQISHLAGTAGGDIYISENGLVLSGYTESTDSSEYLYKYKFITPGEFNTYKILPSATVLFETLILTPQMSGSNSLRGLAKSETADLAFRLADYTGNEVTRAIVDIRGKPVYDNSLMVFELNNRVQAEQVFLEALGPKPDIIYFQPDDQIKMPVYKSSFNGLTELLKPGFAPGFEETYFAFFDNYLVAGNTYETVARLLYDNLLKKTLANDITYRDFESTLPSRAGYFFYCVPYRITDYLEEFLDSDLIEVLRSNKGSLNKIQSAGYQLASSNGMLYNSLSIRYKEEAREESTTEWETLLDTVAAIKPFFFTNHTSGAKEIFIQDMNNNTYLINAAGRVLWKVPLNERILGDVFMIDYFRNGKYQLLFNSKNFLHLLDRNGNYVERYPVRLRSPASNQLAVYDYDNNKNYRLFIAGEDQMIYSYDRSGSAVKGWKPYRTAGPVKSEINYFRISGKDYIVASDEHSVYFLDRTGNIRLNLKEAVTRSEGSAMRLNPGSNPSLVFSAPDGSIQQVYFDGTVRKFRLTEFSANHSFDMFDVNGDGSGEYIFIDKGILYLYDQNRSQLFSRDFNSTDLGGPINFIFSSSDRKIGVFDSTKKLIYLISKDGKTVAGFPLRGASMFSIGRLSDKDGWNLIVGGTDRFLYNYKIETDFK